MSKHSVTLELTKEIEDLMVDEDLPIESKKIAESL